MFTGLIERVGTLGDFRRTAEGGRLEVRCEPWAEPLTLGESVAVQGACLTVTEAGERAFLCDVLGETLQRTSLGSLAAGAKVNLERAMKAGARFGGHMVSGHVDGTGEVAGIRSTGRDWELEIRCEPSLLDAMVPKGSVACDGVSLTLAQLGAHSFVVCVIPHTWKHTSLSSLKPGGTVNIENDLIGKYVYRYLSVRPAGKGISDDLLRKAGFGDIADLE